MLDFSEKLDLTKFDKFFSSEMDTNNCDFVSLFFVFFYTQHALLFISAFL